MEKLTKYFQAMLNSKDDYNSIILADGKIIGHISLAKRQNDWHETQIVIGEKNYRGKGLGSKSDHSSYQKGRKDRYF